MPTLLTHMKLVKVNTINLVYLLLLCKLAPLCSFLRWDLLAPFFELTSQKLLACWLGPFCVSHIDTALDNYTLELPHSMHCHNVFHIYILKPYFNPCVELSHCGPSDVPLPVISKEVHEEFEIDSSINHKILLSNQHKFLVFWKGYDAAHDSW
ncbi:hypothetical protein HK096_011190, partial [Nowakowskiella sp. JEL0078]